MEEFFVCCDPARNHCLRCCMVVALLHSVLELGSLHVDPCAFALVLHAGQRSEPQRLGRKKMHEPVETHVTPETQTSPLDHRRTCGEPCGRL